MLVLKLCSWKNRIKNFGFFFCISSLSCLEFMPAHFDNFMSNPVAFNCGFLKYRK